MQKIFAAYKKNKKGKEQPPNKRYLYDWYKLPKWSKRYVSL